MAVPSPPPRRVKAPSWLDARLLTGVLLVIVSVLVGSKVVVGANHDYPVLASSHDLAAGTLLTAQDVTVVSVRLPDRAVYLAAGHPVAGQVLNQALTTGQLVPALALGMPATATSMTLPLADGAAPPLHSGQRIEVWISTKTCPATVLLGAVTVQSVAASAGSAFSSGGGQNVVLSVAGDLATRVVTALAIDGASIRAGILSGAPVASANQSLPALAPCLAPPTPS